MVPTVLNASPCIDSVNAGPDQHPLASSIADVRMHLRSDEEVAAYIDQCRTGAPDVNGKIFASPSVACLTTILMSPGDHYPVHRSRGPRISRLPADVLAWSPAGCSRRQPWRHCTSPVDWPTQLYVALKQCNRGPEASPASIRWRCSRSALARACIRPGRGHVVVTPLARKLIPYVYDIIGATDIDMFEIVVRVQVDHAGQLPFRGACATACEYSHISSARRRPRCPGRLIELGKSTASYIRRWINHRILRVDRVARSWSASDHDDGQRGSPRRQERAHWALADS